MLGEDALRVKLHAPDWQVFVPDTHDLSLVRLCRHLQAIGNRIALDHERMIARGGEGIGHVREQITAIVLNGRSLAVHHAVIYHHISAERVPDTLVAQTNAKERHVLAKATDDFIRKARFTRRAWPWGNEDAFRFQLTDLIERDLVVA